MRLSLLAGALFVAAGCAHSAAERPLPPGPVGVADAGTPEPALTSREPPDAGEPAEDAGAADAGFPVAQWPSPAQLLLDKTSPDEFARDEVAGGNHVRFGTVRGPVHVWTPPGYRPATAGTVVYLHGYFNSVDSAWDEHHLAEQFAGSGQNALFVVPEAPSGRADDVFWKDLAELLREVRRRTKAKIPPGPVVAVGHSGAYRTLASWLDDPRLAEIILLDGLYGYDDEIAAWAKAARRRLVLVAADTAERTEAFLRRFPRAVRLDDLPESLETLTPEQRSARLLYVPTQRFDHMGLVTQGQVVPLMLGLSPLKKTEP